MLTRGRICTVLTVVVFGIALPAAAAHAATTIKTKKGNATLATALPISIMPDLIIRQKTPNDTLATAQPVSPTYQATDVLGSLSRGQPQAFFSFFVPALGSMHVEVEAKHPTKQFTEILLYDPNANLVAIASGNASDGSGSVVDFSDPNGVDASWTVEVTGNPSHPEPKASFFRYDMRIRTSAMVYTTDVRGRFVKKDGFYQITANDGDKLHFDVSAVKPVAGLPELLLYDQNGNLVAIAAGNGFDGKSSVIDFTVPDGFGGNWTVQVTGSPNAPDPKKNHFTYDLQIRGATGAGPVIPR